MTGIVAHTYPEWWLKLAGQVAHWSTDYSETASYVFTDENYIEMYDFEHSIEEDRYIAIGCVGDVLFVVFTERKENIRLISARLATESERRLYYDQNIYY